MSPDVGTICWSVAAGGPWSEDLPPPCRQQSLPEVQVAPGMVLKGEGSAFRPGLHGELGQEGARFAPENPQPWPGGRVPSGRSEASLTLQPARASSQETGVWGLGRL